MRNSREVCGIVDGLYLHPILVSVVGLVAVIQWIASMLNHSMLVRMRDVTPDDTPDVTGMNMEDA